MTDLEFPAGFYLGREYDLAGQTVTDQPILYDARDLTTHGIVVGMTGSGKTGLCITLLEEAALDNIPCIIIDLKGDLSNLLLNFPEMKPADFEPWVNPDEARRQNVSIEEYARNLADTWKKVLAEWGQSPERVERLRQSSDWRVYTPGSEAGLPVSVIQNFTAPRGDIGRELLTEKVEATTTALLGLMNIPSDPVQSREHILIANLLLHAWTAGRDLDLPHLISQIQSPPMGKIGTFDVDMFYPENDRLKLAVTLNNLLASPTFSTWIHGDALDLASMLYAPDGRPRQLIFYLAHLDEGQRMFFLTLLLQEVVTWTRSQPGATSLRAILYFDEVFGYLPPHPANPPTKQPLLTLLKQARAFGVGILLATQNPVDLDYKALTNAGTWFVGKLRTDRDKDRLLEGLEGVAAEQGTLTDRAYLDTAISSLGNRVFLLHDVHRGQPALFQTRWALSYLYGPLMRDQIAQLSAPMKAARNQARAPEGASPAATPSNGSAAGGCPKCGAAVPAQANFCMQCGTPLPGQPDGTPQESADNGANAPAAVPPAPALAPANVPPVLPPGTVQYFLPVMEGGETAADQAPARLHYEPRLLGFAEVMLTDRTKKHEHQGVYRLLAPPPEPGCPVAWDRAEEIGASFLPALPEHQQAVWADVPKTMNDPKKLRGLERSLVKYLYDHSAVTQYQNRSLKLMSEPGETRAAFLARCREAVQAEKEEELTQVRDSYRVESQDRKRELLRDVQLKSAERKVMEEWQAALNEVEDKWQRQVEDVKEIRLSPRKADIRITHFGLAWAPFRSPGGNGEVGALTPAYERSEPAQQPGAQVEQEVGSSQGP